MDFIKKDIQDYAARHTSPANELLEKIDRETNLNVLRPRMLSGHVQGRILSMIAHMIKPDKVLEIGTYTGYSALCMAEGLAKDGQLITIDVNEELEPIVQQYFEESCFKDQLQYLIGNAMELIPPMEGSIDLVFIDADKTNYSNYFDLVIDKMSKGGFIIADNILWSGKVTAPIKSNDKDTIALVEFNNKVHDDPRVENVLMAGQRWFNDTTRFMKQLSLFILCLISWNVYADDENVRRVRVPSEITLGDMKLKINDAARRNIQKDVDALTKSPKFMEIKADRARIYFPIIEKVFKEEGVPLDFKFLALQESALISDAVSSANAVGFWQFKDFTGREVGLRIDRSVDERLNIVASTHGAAKYFKRHNFYFDNWVYTILAHMTGRGGAGKYVEKKYFGKKRMTLDGKTHWYVIRFLAHKIAYEGITGGANSEGLKLVEYRKGKGKTLSDIAKDAKIDEEELKKYNKWLKTRKVPGEKEYSVMLPVRGKAPKMKSGKTDKTSEPKDDKDEGTNDGLISVKIFPSIDKDLNVSGTIYIKINGIPSILAKKGDGINVLARKAQITPEKFIKYNDLKMTSIIKEGEIYYTKRKRNRAKIYFYTVQPGENLWDVSQKFGIKLVKLVKLNHMATIDDLEPGRVLWMRKKRPSNMPIEYRELPKLPVDEAIPLKEVPLATPEIAVADTMVVENGTKEEVLEDEIEEIPKEESEIELVPKVVVPAQGTNNVVIEAEAVTGESVTITNHLVTKGETLYGIAQAMGISVSDLIEWNDLYDTSIKVGQNLIVHGTVDENLDTPEDAEVTFHVVEPGDTMYGISKKYGLAVTELLNLNQKENFNLDVGERLRVK